MSIHSSVLSLLYGPTLTPMNDYWKTIALTIWTFVDKVISLLFNTLSRFLIAFLLRNKHLLASWLQSPATVILKLKKIKSVNISFVFPSICHEVMQLYTMILVFECWVLSQFFHYPLSPSSRDSNSSLIFCHKGGVMCISEVAYIFPSNIDSSMCFIQLGILHEVLCI